MSLTPFLKFALLFVPLAAAAAAVKLPRGFEPAPEGRNAYLYRGPKYTLALGPEDAVLTLAAKGGRDSVRLRFIGADPAVRLEPLDVLPGAVNYFRGNDARAWRAGVHSYARVRYRNLYPGIDLVFHNGSGELEYDFLIAPGGDPARIRLRFDGASPVVRPDGSLVLPVRGGDLVQRLPVAWQESGAARAPVRVGYRIAGQEVRFTVGAYDRALPLIVDPVLTYATYLGGSSFDGVQRLVTDPAGNIYATGATMSADFPVSAGAADRSYGGGVFGDVWVAKFTPAGAPLYITYLGGSGDDGVWDIAVDAAGNAYVSGFTGSTDFPNVAGSYRSPGHQVGDLAPDGYVVKLNPAGSALVYAALIGGSQWESAYAVAIDALGNAYVTGHTSSADFPATPGALQTARRGNQDIFVTKLNPAGSALVYSTYLGGTGNDPGIGVLGGIAVDTAGNAYISGNTSSLDFPVTAGAPQNVFGGSTLGDGFVAKLNPTGTALVFATYLGGSGVDEAKDLAIDAAGNVYVVGRTTSPNFPVTPGAPGPTLRGSQNAFVSKLNAAGTSLLYSTYLGGSGFDDALSLVLESSGRVYVVGRTSSRDFPVTRDALQATIGTANAEDGFLARLTAAGTLDYASYFGGPGVDAISAVAFGANGVVVIGASTDWTGVPVSSGAFRTAVAGRTDAVIAVLSFDEGTSGAAPSLTAAGTVNAASFRSGAVAPGEIVTIFGSGFGPQQLAGLTLTPQGGVQTSLANTRVLFDGVPAPLIYVVANQLSLVVPYEVAGRVSTNVEIEYAGVRSAAVSVPVAPSAPAIFTQNASGGGAAVIQNQDNSLNTAAAPAVRGSVITIYATGEGRTNPPAVTGSVTGSDPPRPVLDVRVEIGGASAEVVYAGGAPGAVAGVFQVNARVPQSIAVGAVVPIFLSVGLARSPAGVSMSIR